MADACTAGLDTGFVSLGYARVAFLGIVQGLTELMPISSTAHMRIVPSLLGWQDPGSAFSAAMQLAALAAVVCYFWKDVRGLVGGSVSAAVRGDFQAWDFRFAMWIVLATIPIVLAGLALSSRLNACGSSLRSLQVIGLSCIVMGILLAVAELYCRHRRVLANITLLDAMVVGIAQIGALIPGVSRSGSTLTAALFLDLKREEAARFSFLLGLPAIALAGLKELYELHKAHLDAHGWSILAVGLVVGSISAFLAIFLLMRILERFSTWPFVVYRIFIGIVLLAGSAMGWLA
ncbi:undecaprenyl-diphosphatase UppP [Lichenihabitans sp. PAMC28606]|uniref:undecaprenyl-diphosphatase UppP n=1 Tax=Lichenihabitans sp. PAMC28606 TaxID=2880932 RepID=UPI001D0A8F65|nr:undecaprenyl-diphosphatase UppP [Lichenihabitans sp. PAMC28606]UDL96346.1 undecaprenyl-diphosphatase UppP [Lichenihabitans sp. PAMC28606]